MGGELGIKAPTLRAGADFHGTRDLPPRITKGKEQMHGCHCIGRSAVFAVNAVSAIIHAYRPGSATSLALDGREPCPGQILSRAIHRYFAMPTAGPHYPFRYAQPWIHST
jgi:hypothetical protein